MQFGSMAKQRMRFTGDNTAVPHNNRLQRTVLARCLLNRSVRLLSDHVFANRQRTCADSVYFYRLRVGKVYGTRKTKPKSGFFWKPYKQENGRDKNT